MTLLMGGEAMRRNPKKGGQFAIIWVDLLYEDSVPATAKILFGEIYRLSGPDGWCDASNQDFMDLLGCSESTVRNLLKALEDVGQIRVESRPRRGGSGGTERYIFCGRKLAPPDASGVPAENCGYQGGTRKNLRGVPAENCGSTYSKSNKRVIPPVVPQDIMAEVTKYAGEDQELLEAIREFLINRATPPKANPVKTPYGMRRLLRDLDKLSEGNREIKLAVLDKAIKHNWRGLFALKPDELPQRAGREAGDEDGI